MAPERHRPWSLAEGIPFASPEELGPFGVRNEPRSSSELLLVDTFPVGIDGELRPILERNAAPAWLLARGRRQPISTPIGSFVGGRFEQVFEIEPGGATDLPVRAIPLPPITIREPAGCLPRAAARRALGALPDERVVLFVATGGAERETEFIRVLAKGVARVAARLAGVLRVVVFAAELPERELPRSGDRPPIRVTRRFPAMELFRGADALVVGGGCASISEVRALGLRPIVVPQSRRFDDQFARSAGELVANSPAELEDALVTVLSAPPPIESGIPAHGGAEVFADAVVERFRGVV